MKKVNHYLPEQQIEALVKLSKQTGISVSEHIRRAISDYLDREKNDHK
jgi:metal-responsive CopG/Arc/MetJ family transcriptional regulator